VAAVDQRLPAKHDVSPPGEAAVLRTPVSGGIAHGKIGTLLVNGTNWRYGYRRGGFVTTPNQIKNPRSGFLRKWVISFSTYRDVLSAEQKAAMKKALVEHLRNVDEADQALAAMEGSGHNGEVSTS
jgi:hypothetical protein